MRYLFLLLVLVSTTSYGQKIKKADKAIISQVKTIVTKLASDEFEGRRTGTPGEKKAAEYIISQFERIGLSPKGDDNGYLQAFDVQEGKVISQQSFVTINGDSLKVNDDYFPFVFSANKSVRSFASPAIQESNAPWFADIKDVLEQNASNPHFDLLEAIRTRAAQTAAKGANALIVYNSGSQDAALQFDGKSKATALTIPVIFLNKNAAQKYLSEKTTDLNIAMDIAIEEKHRTGHNVVGFIDNGAPKTVVIGAHYDHLGYGEDHNSLWTGARAIHNGADDNASGVATVMELAKLVKNSKLKNTNYLFICFSGEELGLFGSKYFTEHPTIPLESVNYMINCDMVGRLHEDTKALTVGGYGTSPAWSGLLPANTPSISVKFDSSGIGPSDHTSFYLKNIPVLFFFTGTHMDYHKPSDDADKINYTGELRIIRYIYDVLAETDKGEKLAFTKTREPQTTSARFTVSLGVMPDYTYSGSGLRIDGIIDGRVADKAGLKAGDVVISIGSHKVTDINQYMAALAAFKKGDATKVTVTRGEETIVADIVF